MIALTKIYYQYYILANALAQLLSAIAVVSLTLMHLEKCSCDCEYSLALEKQHCMVGLQY